MSTLVSHFIHQFDVSTLINGECGEIQKWGQIFQISWQIFTEDFCQRIPFITFQRPFFFNLSHPGLANKESQTEKCVLSKHFCLKIKKLYQLGVTEILSLRALAREIKETHYQGSIQQVAFNTVLIYPIGARWSHMHCCQPVFSTPLQNIKTSGELVPPYLKAVPWTLDSSGESVKNNKIF